MTRTESAVVDMMSGEDGCSAKYFRPHTTSSYILLKAASQPLSLTDERVILSR